MDDDEPDQPDEPRLDPVTAEVTPEQLAAVVAQWLTERPGGASGAKDGS